MKVKDLKKLLESIPGDHEVMINASVPDFTTTVSSVQTGTLQLLTDTGDSFLGLPVVGSKDTPILVLSD